MNTRKLFIDSDAEEQTKKKIRKENEKPREEKRFSSFSLMLKINPLWSEPGWKNALCGEARLILNEKPAPGSLSAHDTVRCF